MQFQQFQSLPHLRHLVTTRRGGVSKSTFASLNLGFHVGDDPVLVRQNRQIVADSAGFDIRRLTAAQQVHGNRVAIVSKDDAGRGAIDLQSAIPAVDALVTAELKLPLLIQVADCAPVLLADSGNHVLAVAHAGWRGALAGIVGKTWREMQQCSAQPKSTFVGIGPCLCVDCLEVGEEVADLVTPLYPAAVHQTDVKPHIDLRAIIRQNLVEAGIDPSHIEAATDCPKCHTEKYFSYRGDGKRTGRFGLIAWWE